MNSENEIYPKVFTWLFIGLLITFASAYSLSLNPMLTYSILTSGFVFIILAELGISIAMGFFIKKMSPIAAKICFIAYSILTGLTFSVLFLAFDMYSLILIFLISSAIFAVLAIYGYVTKKDLSRFGPTLFISLLAIIILSILNGLIFKSGTLDIGICALACLIFCGYIIYDLNTVKRLIPTIGEDKAAIYCAFQLYLDFINLFIRLLELFGKRKD